MSQLSRQWSESLGSKKAEIAGAVVEREIALRPDLGARYGALGRQRSLEDAQCHLSSLSAAIQAERAELFCDHIAWAKVTLLSRGVPPDVLAHHLVLMREEVCDALPGEVAMVANAMLERSLLELPQMPVEIPTFLDESAALAEFAREYLDRLLSGDRQLASQLVLAKAHAGTPIRQIYLDVFQPVQRELGRLWQMNRISVGQEHYCSAATQMAMSQLYPLLFDGTRHAHTIVATCVSGDLHDIGVRMLSDLFELDGWNTYYVGASMPAGAIVQALVERQAQILAISVTIATHLPNVEALITDVRANPACNTVKIIVGGYPFNLVPGLWQRVGADGYARDADQAVAVARTLLSAH
ncbi:MAG: cobalamin-dependent protein [Burkholderiales bacterium]